MKCLESKLTVQLKLQKSQKGPLAISFLNKITFSYTRNFFKKETMLENQSKINKEKVSEFYTDFFVAYLNLLSFS